MAPLVPGPDGFLLTSDDPLRAEQRRLDDYLSAEETRSATTPFDLRPWRALPKTDLPNQILAVLQRIAWLDAHDTEMDNAHLARIRLGSLLRVLHSLKVRYAEVQLRALLDQTTPLLGRIAPYGPVERVVEYLKSCDLTPELCHSLRNFQANLCEEMSTSQASMQSLRQQLHMLLWLDEWEALDPSRCWSECVRRDFRALTGEERLKWRALLKHIRGNAPVRMPSGWARQAEPLLATVGAEAFREQMQIWFAPFQSGEPLPLSVAGSHVLKGLVWFCAVAKAADLRECCLSLLSAKWKQKRNAEKALVALGVFGISKEELRARNLVKATPPDPAARLIEKLAQAVTRWPRNRIQTDVASEVIIIQGELHFYRLFQSTGRMECASDNRELELNWPSIPDSMRVYLRRECDSTEQVELRAHMLMHDSIYLKYFRRK